MCKNPDDYSCSKMFDYIDRKQRSTVISGYYGPEAQYLGTANSKRLKDLKIFTSYRPI